MPRQIACPSPDLLDDLRANRLPADQAEEVRLHLGTCPACQQRLAPTLTRPTGDCSFLAPPELPDELGRLGPYRIKGVLGEGGMAIVFDAEEPHLGRQVALKVLRPDRTDATMRARFLQEAQALASLPSDNVVHLYQVGEEKGLPFIAMEKLRGESLEARLGRERSLPVAEALAIARQTAEGLEAVHQRDLIHRDVKPANIWLEENSNRSSGAVKLIDFGIARATVGDAGLTLTGHIVGTPIYMAPEQAAGLPVDGRADLYGLGCVLYRMITGRVPFDTGGPSTMSVLQAVIKGDAPEVRQQAPYLSAPVAALIQRLLSRQPQDRPTSARAVAEELRRLEHQERTTATTPQALAATTATAPRRAGPLGILLGGLAIFAALLVGAVMAYQKFWPSEGTPNEIDREETGLGAGGPDKPPIKVGFLFSMRGYLSVHEEPIIYAVHLAVDEINEAGGVLGRKIEPCDADGASSTARFAQEARRLLGREGVQVIFGCWTSASRKAVATECARRDRLLFYPSSYEGLESNPHVIYLGGTPNQTVIPLVKYAANKLGKRRFFLIGTESVYSYALEMILRHEIEDREQGLGGKIVGTRYLPVGDAAGVGAVVADLEKATRADDSKSLFVINSIDGRPNVDLCEAMRRAGIRPQDVPTAWLTISEPELSMFGERDLVGDCTAACYFESLKRPSNRAFIERLRKRYLLSKRVNDPMETAYAGVYLWKAAVEKAGRTDTSAVREALRGLSFDAPEGPIVVDPVNLHARRTARVGKVELPGGPRTGAATALQFEVVSESHRPLPPEPFPRWQSRKAWEDCLRDVYARLGNAWEKQPKRPREDGR